MILSGYLDPGLPFDEIIKYTCIQADTAVGQCLYSSSSICYYRVVFQDQAMYIMNHLGCKNVQNWRKRCSFLFHFILFYFILFSFIFCNGHILKRWRNLKKRLQKHNRVYFHAWEKHV